MRQVPPPSQIRAPEGEATPDEEDPDADSGEPISQGRRFPLGSGGRLSKSRRETMSRPGSCFQSPVPSSRKKLVPRILYTIETGRPAETRNFNAASGTKPRWRCLFEKQASPIAK